MAGPETSWGRSRDLADRRGVGMVAGWPRRVIVPPGPGPDGGPEGPKPPASRDASNTMVSVRLDASWAPGKGAFSDVGPWVNSSDSPAFESK